MGKERNKNRESELIDKKKVRVRGLEVSGKWEHMSDYTVRTGISGQRIHCLNK